MHSLHILNADLKPGNIFVRTNGRIQITDFGSAVILKQQKNNSYREIRDKCIRSIENNGNAINDNISRTRSNIDNEFTSKTTNQKDMNTNPYFTGGTVDFESPELLGGVTNEELTVGTDLWSLG